MCLGPGRNIYAICDGYPIYAQDENAYYFNVYVPQNNVMVTYMHLNWNASIFTKKIKPAMDKFDAGELSDILESYQILYKDFDQEISAGNLRGILPSDEIAAAQRKFNRLQQERLNQQDSEQSLIEEERRQNSRAMQINKMLQILRLNAFLLRGFVKSISHVNELANQLKTLRQDYLDLTGEVIQEYSVNEQNFLQERINELDAERKSLYGQQMDNYFSYMGLSKIKKGDSVGTEEARESYKYVNGEKVDVPHTHIEINPGFFYNTNILRPWASFAGYGTGVGQLSTIQSPKISGILEANPELEGFSMNPYPYIDAWFEAYGEERA